MGTIQRDSIVKNVLKSLCCSYGWSYGVFWSFDQQNSLFLTMQDAYYEEKIGNLIQNLSPQAPMLGGGIIGQAAFTKKHQWMPLENPSRRQDSSNLNFGMFLGDSEFDCQFFSGIKTIAAVPVEPQGVVQFGSTKKIMETAEFVNQTKVMFQEIVNGQSCPLNGVFACLISPENAYFEGGTHNSVGSMCSASQTQSSFISSKYQPMLIDHNQSTTCLQWSNPFSEFTNDVNYSTLASFKDILVSQMSGVESWNLFPTNSNSPLPLTNKQDLFDSPPDFRIPDEIFQTGDFGISQWVPPSPDQNNVTLDSYIPKFDLLSQNQELIPMNSKEKEGTVTPVFNERQPYNFYSPKLNKHFDSDSTALGPRKGLFSKLGIEELLEGLSGTSNATLTSCIEEQVSSAAKRRKIGNSVWEMSSLQTVVHNSLHGKKEAMPKSEPGLWMGNAYSMNCLSKDSQAKKEVEHLKATKKKAKPGSRPRPKDRQQILDRMAELRELIPNGDKMSIVCLLDRTIKHMLFLQSVMERDDRIKQADEPKNNKVDDPISNGATWAYELGNQTMVCPLIVEDLSTPGQLLIEMLCEEHGPFLEMIDIIRGFGMTILKGVMEVHDKIWVRFIVEAEAKRHVTRHEMFSALAQLLQEMCLTDDQVHNKVIKAKDPLIDIYRQSLQQHPVSLTETDRCINL